MLEAQDAGEAARELGSAAIRQLDGGGVLLGDEVVLAHLERVLLGGTGDDEVAVLVDGDIHRRRDAVHVVVNGTFTFSIDELTLDGKLPPNLPLDDHVKL